MLLIAIALVKRDDSYCFVAGIQNKMTDISLQSMFYMIQLRRNKVDTKQKEEFVYESLWSTQKCPAKKSLTNKLLVCFYFFLFKW